MLRKRFLSLFACTFLFHVTSHAQFELIKDFDGGALSSFNSDYSGILYSIDSKVVVQYDSINAGQYTGLTTLAVVDKQGNSQLLTSIQTNNDNSVFFDFKTLPDGRIAFVSRASDGASKIIISNGTFAGTSEVYTSAQSINGLELIDNGLYFTHDGNPDHALMKIELSTLTVSQVMQFGDFRMISDISKVSNTALIFMAPDAADNDALKLYVSDGTAAGTLPLATIHTGSEFSQNTVMTQVGNKVYFFYKKPGADCCNELWVTDGTNAGTTMLKTFNIIFFTDFVREGKALAWNNRFYFAGVPSGGNTNNDESLWVSDGTAAGTVSLHDPEDYKRPKNLTVFNNTLYFIAYSNVSYANKLYKTDGTAANTGYVSLSSGIYGLSPYAIAADASYLYLAADNNTYGAEVFRYDGSGAQCAVADGITGNTSSDPTGLYVHGTDLYFMADLPASGNELYSAVFTSIPTSTKGASAGLCTLYPNPAAGYVTVKSSQAIVSLRLIGQMGNVLAESTESTMALDAFAEGVYFVQVTFENGESTFEKILLVK